MQITYWEKLENSAVISERSKPVIIRIHFLNITKFRNNQTSFTNFIYYNFLICHDYRPPISTKRYDKLSNRILNILHKG